MTHCPLMLKWFLYTQLCLNVLSSYRWAKHVPCMFSFFHLFDFGNTFIHWMHIHVELCIWLTCHLSQMFIKYNSHIKSCNPYLDCYRFCNCMVHCIKDPYFFDNSHNHFKRKNMPIWVFSWLQIQSELCTFLFSTKDLKRISLFKRKQPFASHHKQ